MSWTVPTMLVVLLVAVVLLAVLPQRLGDRVAKSVGLAASVLTLFVAVLAATNVDRNSGTASLVTDVPWVPRLGMAFHVGLDGLSLPLVMLAALFAVLVAIHAFTMPVARPRAYVMCLLLVTLGAIGTFVSLDLLLFFVFFEVVLAPMWFLIDGWGGHGRRKSANRFILFTLLGSTIMLAGLLLVAVTAGTTNITELATRGGTGLSAGVQLAAALLIGVGLAVKVPMWPLHTWLPDAHTAAPTAGSVLLAAVLLKMGTYGLARVVMPVVPEGFTRLAPALGVLAVAGILWGGLACLAQTDAKRLIAFSSVAHMGFVLLGLATLSAAGVQGALFGNVAHGVITGLLFFLIGAIKEREGTSDLMVMQRSLYGRTPHLAGLLLFAGAARLGLPGLAGFWGEVLAMYGAYEPDSVLRRNVYLLLLAGAAIGAVLAAAYILRLLRRVLQGPQPDLLTVDDGSDVRPIEWVVWSPLVALTLLLGLWPQVLLAVTLPATTALLAVVTR